jgi:hypothetical protein
MPAALGTVGTPLGRTPVAHRLALAVAPVDAVTRRAAPSGVAVGRETPRSLASAALRHRPSQDPQRVAVPVPPGGGAHVVVHDATLPVRPPPGAPPGSPPEVTVRVTDPAGRFCPRRLTVPIWTLGQVRATDDDPPTGTAIPALSRTIRPWLLPGAAYGAPGGATGARLRILHGGVPARWARVELFDGGGARLAWGHGDEHGQVLVLLDSLGATMPANPVPVAVRVHIPPPPPAPHPPADPDTDPLWDLVPEPLPRQPVPAGGFDDDATIGVALPPGYLTASADAVVTLTPGRLVTVPDITFTP